MEELGYVSFTLGSAGDVKAIGVHSQKPTRTRAVKFGLAIAAVLQAGKPLHRYPQPLFHNLWVAEDDLEQGSTNV